MQALREYIWDRICFEQLCILALAMLKCPDAHVLEGVIGLARFHMPSWMLADK